MNVFTIKDLENLSGVKAHTLRIWEQRYAFLKPQRTRTNIRYYSSEELKKILNIALLNKYGYKISHIDRMSDSEISSKILLLSNSQAQHERLINELIHRMIDLELEGFERIIDDYVAARGIEKTITQLVFPFMEKIGILWMTNHINPAQEHLVSNIVRQKLIVGIEGVISPIQSSKKILLFLPEGEFHEIGLLFTYFLLKSRGIGVLYLGASVPLADVDYVINLKKPDFIYTHLTAISQAFHFDRFISQLTQRIQNVPIIISGQMARTYEKKIPHSVQFKKSFNEVLDFISTIR